MVSIAMATYNGDKYIAEQIESILNQTVSDIELVIVDDCSKDNTYEICRQYAQKDKRIRIYRNERNLGYLKNFEKAITLTKGDYIAMSDQDDVWTKDHIEVLLKNLQGKILSCGNVSIVNADLVPTGRTWGEMCMTGGLPDNDADKLMSLIFFCGRYQGASMLFRKELKASLLPFPDGITYHDVWISCLACICGGINYTEQIIASYRIHGNNVSGDHTYRPCKIRSFGRLCLRGMAKDRIYYIRGLRRVGGGESCVNRDGEVFLSTRKTFVFSA